MDEEILSRRALRRYRAHTHQKRRFLERGGHSYFGYDKKFIAYLKEQPKHCSCRLCGNPRRFRYYTKYQYQRDGSGAIVFMVRCRGYIPLRERLTLAEWRAEISFKEQLKEF